MKSTELRKIKDLEKLKLFCNQPKVHGFFSNLWFHSLRSKYPYEFLEYTSQNLNHSYFRAKVIEILKRNDQSADGV